MHYPTTAAACAALSAIIAFAAPPRANATFSIAACEAASGRCGVAVATNNLAVGHGAPFAEAGVGAGISQFETNPCQAPAALSALRRGDSTLDALGAALVASPACADGYTDADRQTSVVAPAGRGAAHTGGNASAYAGQRVGTAVAVAGNELTGPEVLEAMWVSYHGSEGEPLAERLLAALEAGHAAGGQRTGVLSAALLVATPEGWPVDIDLRADFAPGEAIAHVRTAYDANRARTLLFRASQLSDDTQARRLVENALDLAPRWDRLWLTAARLAHARGWEALAARCACHFEALNPAWAASLEDAEGVANCPDG
ncbi:MAG: DUF1028 domain-containing protein [Pseudomonadota bacterium]